MVLPGCHCSCSSCGSREGVDEEGVYHESVEYVVGKTTFDPHNTMLIFAKQDSVQCIMHKHSMI
jgi:hypothetical protein